MVTLRRITGRSLVSWAFRYLIVSQLHHILDALSLFWVQVDLTPISVRALTGVNSSIGLCVVGEKYNVSSMNVLQSYKDLRAQAIESVHA